MREKVERDALPRASSAVRNKTSQRQHGGVTEKGDVVPATTVDRAHVDKSFKTALIGDTQVPGKSAIPSLEVDVVMEAMDVFEGSYVGKMEKGVEVRALQTKLWLAGLNDVRAVMMGSGLVLLCRNSGTDVGEPARNKEWWGGLLSELKIWSPIQVCSTKETWVNMYGIPLHAWGEPMFRNLASRCGVFMEVDARTRKMERFDVARVKVEAPLCDRNDFTVKLVIQGARFFVRVVEKGTISAQDDDDVEDQLRRSEVGSSCASGGVVPARAVLEGLDKNMFDSEGSDVCQQNIHREVKYGNRSKGYNQDLSNYGDKIGGVPGSGMAIPSTSEKVKGIDDNILLDTQSGVGSLPSGHVEGNNLQARDDSHVMQTPGSNPNCLLMDGGPGQTAPLDGLKEVGGASNNDTGVGLKKADEVELVTGHNCVTINHQYNCPRGPYGVEVSSSLSETNTVPHSDTNIQSRKQGKIHKASNSFPSLFGPKCLRFAGVINNCNQIQKRRRKSRDATQTSSIPKSQEGVEVCRPLELDGPANSAISKGTQQGGFVHHQDPHGLELAVCLSFQNENKSESGLHLLLDENSLKDVDGFIAARDSPRIIELEAKKLLQEQQELGFSFNPTEELPWVRMVNMEIRDREKRPFGQESNGFQ
ncbi:hypothetical protein P8452_21601 [Trifolium repens]|nr:hypothetical protein P8452_21601 [Trifolium repens]